MKRKRKEEEKSVSAQPVPKKERTPGGYVFEWVEDDVVPVLEGEIWKPVPDWLVPGNNSFVSNLGRMKTYSGVISFPTPQKDGYVRVGIGGKKLLLHQVILHAFGVKQPSPAHKFGDHIDFDPSNNRLENLRWATAGGNN